MNCCKGFIHLHVPGELEPNGNPIRGALLAAIWRICCALAFGMCFLCSQCEGQNNATTQPASRPTTLPYHSRIFRLIERDPTEAIRLIKDKEVDVNAEDAKGCSLLYFACSVSQTDVVRALIEHGANVSARCTGGATALHVASEM